MLYSSGKGRRKEGTKFNAKLGGERNIKGKEPETQRQNNPNYCSHSNSHSPSSHCQADTYQAATECTHAFAVEAVSLSSPVLTFNSRNPAPCACPVVLHGTAPNAAKG